MTTRRTHAWVAVPLLATAASLCDDDLSRFRLIESRTAETLERDLRAAAGSGYRVLGATQGLTLEGKPWLMALMERAPDPEETYEYAVLAPAADLDERAALEALNALGAAGFEVAESSVMARAVDDWWLPTTAYDAQVTFILERSAVPRRYAYRSVRLNDVASFRRQLVERSEEGYEVLALINSSRRIRAVLGRSLDESTRSATGPDRYQVVLRAIRKGQAHALKRTAARGYRVVAAADQSVNAPALLLLESAPRTYTYKVLAKPLKRHRADKLERKINKRAARGFRVTPRGVTQSALVLERPTKGFRPWHYRVLSSRNRPGLVRGLEDVTARGYRFVTLFADATEAIVLVESETAAETDGSGS